MKLRLAARRLLALVRKRRLDGELEGEILAHLEMAEVDAIAAGLSPEEARREARRGFGGIDQMKEVIGISGACGGWRTCGETYDTGWLRWRGTPGSPR